MKASWCVPAVVLAAIGACSAPPPRVTMPSPRAPSPRYILVRTTERGQTAIGRVALEDYVEAAVISEFAPPAGDLAIVERMLEVQAVVSRTYALAHIGRHSREGFDLCSTTHCQLFDPARLRTSRWAAAAAEAVTRTAGAVIVYRGIPADALFHADCGGRTSSPAAVWGGTGVPYLASIADDGPAGTAHGSWSYDVSRDVLLRALNADQRTRVGNRLDGIEVLDRDTAGRAEQVALHGHHEAIVRGEVLRDVLNRALGPRAVRSTLLDVARTGLTFSFSGRGFGHGVGLCQAGALARVRAGEKLEAILQHYYPGTTLAAAGN